MIAELVQFPLFITRRKQGNLYNVHSISINLLSSENAERKTVNWRDQPIHNR